MKTKTFFHRTIIFTITTTIFLGITGCKKDNPIIPPEDHIEAAGLFILTNKHNPPADTVAYYFKDSVKNGLTITTSINDAEQLFSLHFLDENGKTLTSPTDNDHTLNWEIGDTSFVKLQQVSGEQWRFHLFGKKEGNTTVKFFILHEGHNDFTMGNNTFPISVAQ